MDGLFVILAVLYCIVVTSISESLAIGHASYDCERVFSRYKANSFLTGSSGDCCRESHCEEPTRRCANWGFQNFIGTTQEHLCPFGQVVKVASFCEGGFDYECKAVCDVSVCYHGGTCRPHDHSFTCDCRPGYTGTTCNIDIDECASSPCQNGGKCVDLENGYFCDCVGRFYGVNCEINICHPTPADVVFVLDTSISMTEAQFRKQLDFISTFIDHVHIGPDDFQISVVTYSFDAHIEFYLDEYSTNSTLKQAVKNIQYRPGATFTDKGLKKAEEVFTAGHGTSRRPNGTTVDRFVFVMTDGMSTDRHETTAAAQHMKTELKGYRFRLSTIGIGHDVSHAELLEIASDPSLVYSVQDFDSLYTVLKSLVHYTCDECRSSSVSDVAVLFDVSNSDFSDLSRASVSYVVGLMNVGLNQTGVSLTTYGKFVSEKIGFNDKADMSRLQREINAMVIETNTNEEDVDTLEVFRHIDRNAFSTARAIYKKVVILFSNGNFRSQDSTKIDAVKQNILNQNITIVCLGSGQNVNFEGLNTLVSDAFDVYWAGMVGHFNSLDVLKSYMSYSTCELRGE